MSTKAVKAALDANDFTGAASKAEQLVQKDSKNFTAYLFLGAAYDKLGQTNEAEQALGTAANLKPDIAPPWQGLIKLYEKQGNRKLDRYHDAVQRLCLILANEEDKTKCQDVADKYVSFARAQGSKVQYKHALEIRLPSGPLYEPLEGRIPHPSHTYNLIVDITEGEEKEFVNREIGERRTRLGAKIDQVTLEVRREAYFRFGLEQLYQCMVDWAQDDDTRRHFEEKLLVRALDTLDVLPSEQKPRKREHVTALARGMVIIKHPFELAWEITIEWNDATTYSEWDAGVLREFVEFFPHNGLSKVLKGFFETDICPYRRTPIPNNQATEGNKLDQSDRLAPEDRLLLMVEGLEDATASILAHRIMADLYLSLEEFRVSVEVARRCRELVSELQEKIGINLTNALDSINITLANALITYQSPRHHPEAKALFEDVLARKPDLASDFQAPHLAPPLLGIGLILQEDEAYEEAIDFLSRAMDKDSENIKVRAELAWCKALSSRLGDETKAASDVQDGSKGDILWEAQAEFEAILSQLQQPKNSDLNMKAETLYRVGWCKWYLEPSARKDKNGAYRYFMDSIRTNPSFAPAYTKLGVYFEQYGRAKASKDRARSAFQKAFELSSSEIEAAERLARLFANQSDWDLVELVAQRVVESGKARPAPGSKKKAFSWPFAALGVVQMNKQLYTESVVSFQAALRIEPDDYHSWVGLGESYHNSGRYVAATRSFLKAESLEIRPNDAEAWFTEYMLSNVKRELGAYEEAIAGYEKVLKLKPNEFGVLITLLQTLTESAWGSVEAGRFGAAAQQAVRAIEVATAIAERRSEVFNLWKALGDACSIFTYSKMQAANVPFASLRSVLETGVEFQDLSLLVEHDGIDEEALDLISTAVRVDYANTNGQRAGANGLLLEVTDSGRCAYAAVLAQKRAVLASAEDKHAQAVSWYNLGWAEYRAHACCLARDTGTPLKKQRRFVIAAARCFKRAIELEAGNAEFWNGFGVVTTTLDPKVSQHAFIRSLNLNEKSARVWTNLGTLYLINNDNELANEAFTRAQSSDPDFAPAWIGQGLLALLFGDVREARGLFLHSFDIADSSLLLPKRQYAMTTFDHLLETSGEGNTTIEKLIQPLFALRQLHSQTPGDLPFEHLSGLFAERLGDFGASKSALEQVCSDIEGEYEKSEISIVLSRFAQAKADLARAELARGEYSKAVENAGIALDLADESEENAELTRLSAHLTAGLAHFYLQSMDQAIDMFEKALQGAHGEPDVVCLLAQVLWAKGGKDERNVAREQLIDCVEKHPDHVGTVTLLGVIALLDDDEDAIEAVQADLEAMRLKDKIHPQDRMRVLKVLAGVSALRGNAQDSEPSPRVAEITNSIMLSPGQSDGWMELAKAASEVFPAQMGSLTATRSIPPRGGLEAEELCKALALTGAPKYAQRAIMVAPWLADGWDELSHALTGSA